MHTVFDLIRASRNRLQQLFHDIRGNYFSVDLGHLPWLDSVLSPVFPVPLQLLPVRGNRRIESIGLQPLIYANVKFLEVNIHTLFLVVILPNKEIDKVP
jgi:hypothetical protein